MFESICIRTGDSANSATPIDIGFLAEAMLFYQKVRVVGNHVVLKQLVDKFGAETLIEFLKLGHLSISYQTNMAATLTISADVLKPVHDSVLISSPNYKLQDVAPKIFKESIGRSGRGRRLGNTFASLIQTLEYPNDITNRMREDLNSADYVKKTVASLMKVLAPEYNLPEPFEFQIFKVEKGYTVRTNIDFASANRIYHKRIPVSHSTLSVAYILAELSCVHEHLFVASLYTSELALSAASSSVLQSKVDALVNRRNLNNEQIRNFQDFTLKDGRAIREAINSGEKSFSDVLKILSKASKFKEWLKNQQPDADLCKNYFREATSDTWVEKLPVKIPRWSIFTLAGIAADFIGTGGIGTSVGVGLSLADTFFLDKLLKGWKPNQFVNEHLTKFPTNRQNRV